MVCVSDPFIQDLAARLAATGLAPPSAVRGCAPDEVARVEALAGGKLPETYRGFLATFGRKAGSLFAGTDMFYPAVLDLRGFARELLAENGDPFALPDDAFVFSMHQGYVFLYFRLSEGSDDPAVWQYLEGRRQPERVSERFSAYLASSVDEHLGTPAGGDVTG